MRLGPLLAGIVVAVLGGCFEDTPDGGETTSQTSATAGCEQGLLGCSCFPNGTCSADYVCFAGECRAPEGMTSSTSDGSTTSTSMTASTTDGDSTTSSVDESTGGSSSTGGEPAHVLFITSTSYDGLEVGGLAGADTICNGLGQGLRAVPWVAVLQDASTGFDARIEIDGEVVNTQGETLALDQVEFLSGTLQALPAYDETGAMVPNQDLAWTGLSFGVVEDCSGWSANDPAFLGGVGLPSDQTRWLDTETPLPCSGAPRLYCVSQ